MEEGGLEPEAPVNTWIDVMSTWLSRVRFSWAPVRGGPPTQPTKDPKQRTGYLQVEFLSGATVEYTNPQPYSVFDDLINSSSKGYFLHHAQSHLYTQPYTLLSPPIRKVTAEMRKLREPKSRMRGGHVGGLRHIGRTRPPRLPGIA
jgi:hypothetical protein